MKCWAVARLFHIRHYVAAAHRSTSLYGVGLFRLCASLSMAFYLSSHTYAVFAAPLGSLVSSMPPFFWSPLLASYLCLYDLAGCLFGGVAFMPLALCVARWLRVCFSPEGPSLRPVYIYRQVRGVLHKVLGTCLNSRALPINAISKFGHFFGHFDSHIFFSPHLCTPTVLRYLFMIIRRLSGFASF